MCSTCTNVHTHTQPSFFPFVFLLLWKEIMFLSFIHFSMAFIFFSLPHWHLLYINNTNPFLVILAVKNFLAYIFMIFVLWLLWYILICRCSQFERRQNMFTNNFSLLFILFNILSKNLSVLALKMFSSIFLSLSVAAKQYYHTCNSLEQHTLIVSQVLWVGNPSLAELGHLLVHVAAVTLLGLGSHPRSTHFQAHVIVGKTEFFVGYWTKSLSSFLPVGRRPWVTCHVSVSIGS